MLDKALAKQFRHYLFPSIASLVSLSCYILADTYFVAAGVGSLGLSGLNIAIPAYSLINALGLMLGIGSGVVVAVSRGRGDDTTANEAFGCAFGLALFLGLALTAVGVFGADRLALLMGASARSLPYASTYIRTIMSFSVFFLVNNTLVALVRNDGNPRLAMTSMIICSLSNVVLDFVFIMIFDWGMFGAAFATGLAPIIGLAVLSQHWLRGRNTLYLERKLPRFSLTGVILRGGSSNFIIELGNGLVILLFNFTLMSMAGDVGVAAYGIVANIALVLGYVFIGVGQGMQPIIGQNHGAGNSGAARSILRMALWLSGGLGVAFCALGLVFPGALAALFNSENNLQLAAITTGAIRIYFLGFLFMGINICCASYFQSVLRSKFAAVVSLLRGFVLVVAGVAILPRAFGIDGVWMIVPAAEILTAFVALTGVVVVSRREKNAAPETSGAEASSCQSR